MQVAKKAGFLSALWGLLALAHLFIVATVDSAFALLSILCSDEPLTARLQKVAVLMLQPVVLFLSALLAGGDTVLWGVRRALQAQLPV